MKLDELMSVGLWPFLCPIDITAPDDTPKSIFISGFDSHPLAPDYDLSCMVNQPSLMLV